MAKVSTMTLGMNSMAAVELTIIRMSLKMPINHVTQSTGSVETFRGKDEEDFPKLL